jgi:hydrogenase-4 component B
VAVLLLLVLLGRVLQRRAATHVTWGCGYGAPNTRMQYSGTSFSSQLAAVFKTFLPQLRREELPQGYFPASGRLSTHHVDAVERRMFAVLGDSESLVARVVAWIPDEPRFTFAAGLLVLGVIAGFVVLGGTP